MVGQWRRATRKSVGVAGVSQGAGISIMEACTVAQIARGAMDEEDEDELGCPSSSSSGADSGDSSEFMDDAASAPCSSSSCCSSSPEQRRRGTAIFEMSSLMAQLPFKRGLSKHFQGKSQSFASLSGVTRLEDLAKPERPYKRRLRPCKSYGGGMDAHAHRTCSGAISKKPPRGVRQGFLGVSRPPVPPHRSGGFSPQTLLFA